MDFVSEAEWLAKRLLKGKPGKFVLLHTIEVVDVCKKFGKDLDQDVLLTAAWLHDIGRLFDDKSHQRAGTYFAQGFLWAAGADAKFIERVAHCISEHGTSGRPKTAEARLLRQADAVSVFSPMLVLAYLFSFKSRERVRALLEKQLKKIKEPELLEEAFKRFRPVKWLLPPLDFSQRGL